MTEPRDPRRPPQRAPVVEEEAPLELGLDDLLEAPAELPMDALMVAEDGAEDPTPPPELDPYDLAALDDPFGENVPAQEDIPLLEGFESTVIEERAQRPKPEQRIGQGKVKTEFVITACASCGTPQPDPAPAFCETCGQRQRKAPKKEDPNAARTKRCGECGYRNREDKSACTNCGMRLPSSS